MASEEKKRFSYIFGLNGEINFNSPGDQLNKQPQKDRVRLKSVSKAVGTLSKVLTKL